MFLTKEKRWFLSPQAPPSHLALFPDLPPLVVQLLYNRGVVELCQVRAFLSEEYEDGNPFLLKGMNQAITRIRQAIRGGEKMAIYGDFDADGITATLLLVETMLSLGGRALPYIPHRIDEGYGLNAEALWHLARQEVKLVVTADCGIRSSQEVSYGQGLGLDIIITDHHSVPKRLPPAHAIINPKQKDCPYPFKELSGVALAFKLAQGLLRSHRQAPIGKQAEPLDEEELLDLVALGTVADLVPLLGENRQLVKQGLEKLNQAKRPGIEALVHLTRIRPGQIGSEGISFILAPRLNAAGRLGDAMQSYELLASTCLSQAHTLAEELEKKNRLRQKMTDQALAKAREEVILSRAYENKLLLVAGPEYFSGIVGLVASRLMEEFYRPTLVIEQGLEECRGSARSIPEFNIVAALEGCDDLLTRYGGHSMAAGFTFPTQNLNPFRARLTQIAEQSLAEYELAPSLIIDAQTPISEVGWSTHALLERLAPFGTANPQPLFLSRRVSVLDHRLVGERHLKVTLAEGRVRDAIAFEQGEQEENLPGKIDIVYSLEANEWEGERRLQLNIKDMRP